MTTVRLLAVGWWMQLKIRSRSAFDGILGVLYPMFFATTVFLMYHNVSDPTVLVSMSVGAAMMGVWSATSTTAGGALQQERRQGTLELLVAAPRPFALLIVPMTLSMATIGLYALVATLLWGRLAFGIPIDIADPAAFLLAVAAAVVSIGLTGYLLAMASVRYRSGWALGSMLEMAVWLVCGFLVPLAVLPSWLQPVAKALPPTWGMAAVRDAALGQPAAVDAALCLGLGAVYAVGGTLLGRRLVDSARTHATLALV